MPAYETVFAVPAAFSEEERAGSLKAVEELITGSGGEISSVDEMGERRMAYPVKKHEMACYYSILFNCPPSALDGLKRHFRLDDRYIRDITVRKDEK